jgi:hypothetical protein
LKTTRPENLFLNLKFLCCKWGENFSKLSAYMCVKYLAAFCYFLTLASSCRTWQSTLSTTIYKQWSSIVKNCWICLSYAFTKLISTSRASIWRFYWFEHRCVVLQSDLCYGADLMIMASTLDTRWELLHQCLAEDSGPTTVDPAAEATPAGSGASDGLGCRCCGRALFQGGSSKETRREIRINLLMLSLVCALVNSKSAAFRRRRACRIHETKKS